jgi:lipid-A-disaccharide synthase
MKYYVISGEASGDLHGSNLINHLIQKDPKSNFRAWGGELMQAQGAHIVKHYKELAFMGFFEVIMNLGTVIKNINFCKQDLLKFQPDTLILIDYPGFNMRIAKFAKSHQIPVYYYISPQVWAWKKNRVYQIKKYVKKLYTILPFEKGFYAQFDCEVEYLGHPLLDAVSNYMHLEKSNFTQWKIPGRPLVALLPGSREQELNKMLSKMVDVVREFPHCDFVIAGVASLGMDFYQSFVGKSNIQVVFNQTYNLFEQADAALVSSGTATLETALFNVPQVVCYQTSTFSYYIAKLLVDVKYISLVNLISQSELVKELIQQDLTVPNMVYELNRILDDLEAQKIKSKYFELRALLGGEGASERVAHSIFNDLKVSD